MLNKIRLYRQMLLNMGWRYMLFRVYYEYRRKSGKMKKKFPTNVAPQNFISLKQWQEKAAPFFLIDKDHAVLKRYPDHKLEVEAKKILDGVFPFFNSFEKDLGYKPDWLKNPDTGFLYDIKRHWTEVEDLDPVAGDIKYVWERARFSFVPTILRYDYHFKTDCSKYIIGEILSFIKNNPINQGPQYKCSQEISLRLMNWIMALYYYRNSPQLMEEDFKAIMNSIYWQVKHVENNIDFSRIAVRNNHAVTECLMLYTAGLLFPFMPEAAEWKRKGKQWFEEEILYQVSEDGTYLQYSMNYNRVVLQLMTWAFVLAEVNSDQFSDKVYERACRTIDFLYSCQDRLSGQLPNYGANDGALFFRFVSSDFRDYRPQLNCLYYFFNNKHLYHELTVWEEASWFIGYRMSGKHTAPKTCSFQPTAENTDRIKTFVQGGYAVLNEPETLTFLRSGAHPHRPSQADNLHLDLWYQGQNIMRDAGSYMYNTDPQTLKYFNGTVSHNTVMLGEEDQMKKGPRFVWLYWSQGNSPRIEENEREYLIHASAKVFRHLSEHIVHKRTVYKTKGQAEWRVEDSIEGNINLKLRQLWHPAPRWTDRLEMLSKDAQGQTLTALAENGWYSGYYGQKESSQTLIFETNARLVTTTIRVR